VESLTSQYRLQKILGWLEGFALEGGKTVALNWPLNQWQMLICLRLSWQWSQFTAFTSSS